MINFIGIDQRYPILLGSTMKYFLQNGFNVSRDTFLRFVMFLERCKGFEEDAKRFVFLTQETDIIQMDYEMVRPLFQRTMMYKSGQDVLKLFEQIRKNMKLNKASKQLGATTQQNKLKALKSDIYDGLIADLLERDAYQLAQVIFGEKKREKYEETTQD